MARKPKAPKPKLDRAQEKARKQRRLAAILGVVLVVVLVYEVPHTMKMMNTKAKAPIVTASAATPPVETPTVTPTPSPSSPSTSTLPAASPSASSSTTSDSESGLVSSVQVTPDEGQLTQFARFASKDPFQQTIQKDASTTAVSSGSVSTAGKTKSSTTTTTTAKTPPSPPPTSAVISLNGELMSVGVGTAFPTAGTTFSRVGSLFKLDSLTAKTAKVSIVGGSYADGAGELALDVGEPITLENTADGTRYTLILEPPGTPIPTSTTPTATTPTTTTPLVVPSSPTG